MDIYPHPEGENVEQKGHEEAERAEGSGEQVPEQLQSQVPQFAIRVKWVSDRVDKTVSVYVAYLRDSAPGS